MEIHDADREIIQRELKKRLYTLDQKIGRGNFADVWRAHHDLSATQNSKITVAIKVIDKRERSDSDLTKINREIEILKKLRHPHIIRLYQVFESGNFIFLVTELCGKGELFDLIVDMRRLNEPDARRIFSEILSAVEHAHSNAIVHRDLKTENVLLDEWGNVKLADFGFGQYFSSDRMLNTWCGSPPYAAPEVFEGKEYEGPELDCWSLGCILYVLVCGKLPFDAPDMAQLKELITNGRYQIPWFISNECFDLIKKCLMPNSRRRIKMCDIRGHAWLQGLQSVVEPIEPVINQNVLDVMASVGIDRQKIIDAVQTHAFNELFALYHLLLDKEKSQLRSYRQNHFNHQQQQQQQYNRQFSPSVDQYGFPTMHEHQTPAVQQQQQLSQQQQQQQHRRHTVNNVLSTITPNQQQSLQQMYRDSHPSPLNSPSPRHSPLSNSLPHHQQQQQATQQQLLHQQLVQKQQQQRQQQAQAAATAEAANSINPNQLHPEQYKQFNKHPPSHHHQQVIHHQQQSQPQSNERRPWRQGRRASDGLLNGINREQMSLFEQINPVQMIQEAEDDYDHTWSSIRHPATQVPKRRSKHKPHNHHHHQDNNLTTVPEEIPQLSQLAITTNSTTTPTAATTTTPMAQLLMEQMRAEQQAGGGDAAMN